MVDVRAFKGTFYNPEQVKDLRAVTAPPYDVISPAQREEYEAKHPCNIVRLILSQETDADTDENNKYTRARDTLANWLCKKQLKVDAEECFYIYEQEFTANNVTYHRLGFIGRVRLEEFSSKMILPHEKTYAGPRTDRQNLLRIGQTNLSQIFALYNDPQQSVDKILVSETSKEPLFDLVDDDQIRHRIWRLTDADKVSTINKLLRDEKIFIADGHHRYESSLNYRNEMLEKNPEASSEESFNFTMMTMISMNNPGLIILPTHRLLNGLDDFNLNEFITKASPFFEIEVIECTAQNRLETLSAIEERIEKLHLTEHVFALYTGTSFIFMRQIDPLSSVREIDEPRTDEWKQLDVTILHHFILKKIMQYDPKPGQIKYTPKAGELLQRVDSGEFQLGFILAPTKIEEVQQIASLHEIMPQKSTYFYPKLLSGLVLNQHNPAAKGTACSCNS